MSEPFLCEIRMFAGDFAPRGWALCDGQLLSISENDPLFSLLGTIYGGDGRTTFGLPDLRGRLPLHAGTGPGLTERRIGSKSGVEQVTLNSSQLPSHQHTLRASADPADSKNARGRVLAHAAEPLYAAETSPPAPLHPSSITSTGAGQPHSNVMPFLCVHFIIALFGIYPSRH